MISQANSSVIRNAYANSLSEPKEAPKKSASNVSSQGDLSKVDQIKNAIDSGDYKVNLQALSEKIADELL